MIRLTNHEKSERNLYHFYDFERLYRWPLATDHSPSGIGRATLMLSRMTPEAQREAIGEACGWKWKEPDCMPKQADICLWFREDSVYLERLPDYPNDLNAMYEAEKVLPPHRRESYNAELSKVAIHGRDVSWVFQLLTATASQRAEAFLRVIGQWDDSK